MHVAIRNGMTQFLAVYGHYYILQNYIFFTCFLFLFYSVSLILTNSQPNLSLTLSCAIQVQVRKFKSESICLKPQERFPRLIVPHTRICAKYVLQHQCPPELLIYSFSGKLCLCLSLTGKI